MNTHINNGYRGLFSVILILYLLHNAPAIGFYMPPLVYAAILALLYALTFLMCGTKRFNSYLFQSIPAMGLTWMAIMYSVVSSTGSFGIEIYGLAQLAIYFIIGLYIIDTKDYQMAKRVLLTFILIYVVTSVTTYIGDSMYPMASRDLTGSASAENAGMTSLYLAMNIGGFGFIYNVVLLIPIIIGLYRLRLLNIFLSLSMLALFYLVIEKSQFTTALLISILFMPLLIWRKFLTRTTAIRYFFFVALVIMMANTVLPSLLNVLSDTLSGDATKGRLTELSGYLSSGETSDMTDIDARQNHYTKSLDAFLSSPIIGSFDKTTIGGHSLLFDTLGLYGLVGLFLYIVSWKKVFTSYLKPIRNKPWYGYFFIVFAVAILLTIVNPQMNMMFLFLIIPCYILQYEKNLSTSV